MDTVMTLGIAWAGFLDYKNRRVPLYLQALLYGTALFNSFWEAGFTGILNAFLSSMAFFIPGYLLYKHLRAMGGADVKMAAVIGAWCGVGDAYMIILLAAVLAVIVTLLINYKNGILAREIKTAWVGIYLIFVCRVKGDTGLGQLPEDITAPSPPNTIPFVTFLALAVLIWQVKIGGLIF